MIRSRPPWTCHLHCPIRMVSREKWRRRRRASSLPTWQERNMRLVRNPSQHHWNAVNSFLWITHFNVNYLIKKIKRLLMNSFTWWTDVQYFFFFTTPPSLSPNMAIAGLHIQNVVWWHYSQLAEWPSIFKHVPLLSNLKNEKWLNLCYSFWDVYAALNSVTFFKMIPFCTLTTWFFFFTLSSKWGWTKLGH